MTDTPSGAVLRAALDDIERMAGELHDTPGHVATVTSLAREIAKTAYQARAALAATEARPETDLDVERLARALRFVEPPDPEWAENAAAASGQSVNWKGWAEALADAYRRDERP